jgi:hypothetical protein
LKSGAVMHVALPSPFRQQNFDRLADQFSRLVTEHCGQLAVDLPDDAAAVDSDDGIRDEVERYRSVRHHDGLFVGMVRTVGVSAIIIFFNRDRCGSKRIHSGKRTLL